jgi:tRNA A37 threonylcarbamoyladenosine biosynthesis protein TsaE
LKLFLPNEQATKKLGAAFGRHSVNRVLIALSGQLGTGKTVFVKALARSLGIKDVVTSPTFVLMNEYTDARLPLYHIDLYRTQEASFTTASAKGSSNAATETQHIYDCRERTLNALDFLKAELQEVTRTPSVVVIEWAEFLDQPDQNKSKHFLSAYDHLTLELRYVDGHDSARIAEIAAIGENSADLLRKVMAYFEDAMI